DVVPVVDGIHHLADVGGLDGVYLPVTEAVHGPADGAPVYPSVNAVDVVVGVEGMPPPGPALGCGPAAVGGGQPPALEQHHGDVDAKAPRGTRPGPLPLEVGVVEPAQVELRLAIEGHARPVRAQGSGATWWTKSVPSRPLARVSKVIESQAQSRMK